MVERDMVFWEEFIKKVELDLDFWSRFFWIEEIKLNILILEWVMYVWYWFRKSMGLRVKKNVVIVEKEIKEMEEEW